jgi:hypothetical protein
VGSISKLSGDFDALARSCMLWEMDVLVTVKESWGMTGLVRRGGERRFYFSYRALIAIYWPELELQALYKFMRSTQR